jgi:hypothetical protein
MKGIGVQDIPFGACDHGERILQWSRSGEPRDAGRRSVARSALSRTYRLKREVQRSV